MFVESITTIPQRGARLLTVATMAVALAGATPLRAQAPTQTPAAIATPITIGEAIQIALRQNGTLLQAKNAATLDAATVRQRKLQFLPNLQVSASTGQSYGGGTVAGVSADQSTQSVSAGVSSSLTLFDGLKNAAQLKGAQLTSQASEQDLTRANQTVVYTVASNFIDLGKQAEQLRIQQQNLAAQEAQQKEIEAYVNAGTRPISDLYQQQATVASTRAAVVDAQNAWELAKVNLMQTLQLDPRGTFEFEVPSVDSAAAMASVPSLDSLLSRALAQRADLSARQSRVDAAKQDVRAAGAARWPTVSLTAGYSSAFNSGGDASFWNQLDQRRGASIGIDLSIPLFDRGATSLATQQARIQADNARIALETQQREVGLEVRRAYLDLQAAQQQVSAARAQLRAAQRALDATEQRYRVGAATLVELAQARATQVQAQSALIGARYDVALQRTMLAYSVGDLDPQHVALG